MRARLIGSLAVGFLLLSTSPIAQAPSGVPLPGPRPQVPPRDGAAVAVKGTARIRGRVVAADSGAPLRRAQIRLTAPQLKIARGATTDSDGRYEFAGLPAGRYSLFVSRNGYVSLQFGQRRPFETGRPLEMAEGQVFDPVDFALPRGGVISGRITDDVGEPMAGARVQAMRYQYSPTGQRELAPAMGGPFGIVTNDLGEYRLYGLMPGTYVVSAVPEMAGLMATMVSTGGSLGGTASEPDGLGTTYYPGTLSPEDAQSITVAIGQEANASFALAPTRVTRIAGIIRTSQGKPAAGVIVSVRTRSGGTIMSRMGAATDADGAFTIAELPAGEHWLEVFGRGGEDEFASVPITAAGGGMSNLVISLTPGATISGQVIFEGNSAGPRPGRIAVTPAEPGAPAGRGGGMDTGVIDEAGRFQIRGAAGRVLFRSMPIGMAPGTSNWVLKSVTVNGEDVTDTPIDLARTGSLTGVEIVLTDRQTTVSGTARTARGEPVEDYTVAIFPAQLKEGMVQTRFIRIARPDQQGRFELRGLPPGEYFAVAVESLDQGQQWDPDFQQRARPLSTRLTLAEGQSLTIQLQLQP